MEMNDYQLQAAAFAIYPEDPEVGYISMAIMGESGEVANVYKKELRSGEEQKDKMIDELGDIWWYLASLCTQTKFVKDGRIISLQELYDSSIKNLDWRELQNLTLRQHIRKLVKGSVVLDEQLERYNEYHSHLFYFASDILKEVLWLMSFYMIELDTVLEYNLKKLQDRANKGQIKNHD